MKRLIYSLIFFLNVITSFATDISTWSPPAGGLKNTYSDSKTFVAKKGDILNCRCKGQISSGSYVNLYITGQGKREKIFTYNTSNNSFDKTITYDVPEDTEYTLEYEYYHNGGGTAYNIKVFASLTESISEEYTYPLENNDIIHVNGLHYVCNGGTLTFGKCDIDKYSGEITIPETVDYRGYRYTVTGINAYSFQNNKNITKLFMPNSIIDMGNNVFQGCTSLDSVRFSDRLEQLPDHTFYGCIKIQNFSLPKNITSIGSYAFYGTGIEELFIPSSITEIGSNAFEGCKSLTSVVLGNSVNSIGSSAFRSCSALNSVTVGASLFSLTDVFTYCTNVKELIYAEGCKKTIDTGLTSISSVSFPNTMEEIHDKAFYRYHNLTGVNFTPSIKSIGESAFQECEGLTTLSLPENLQNIGVKAFYYCKNIVGELIIPSTVRELGESSFDGCSNIQTLIIKNGVEIIGNKAFENCKSLENVYFSNTLQSIGEYAFCGSIYSNQLKFITLPLSLKNIGGYAFSTNSNLTNIEIPGNVETIGDYAFYKCKNIKSVKLNEGIVNIGKNAFYGCYNFNDLFVPNSAENIGEGAFAPWTGGEITSQLKTLTIGNGVKTFKNITCGVNQGSAALEKIVIGSGISSINDYNIQQRGVMFLLTNNVVTGIGPKVYVADSTKYSDTQIKNHNIRNLIKSSSYKGEYNGKAPEIGMVNNLDGYTATILPEFYNAGTYTSMDVEFTDGRLTSIVSIPCNYTITKAQLKVVANDIVVSYGEDIPNLEYSYVGFKNSETEDVAISTKPTITTSAKKGSQSGTYTISIAGAEARNYSLSYQNGTLTIKKAPQTIEWNQTFPTVYNGDQIELNAVSSCGLPISYTTSNADIAFVSNENGKAILHLLKDGIVQITATQSGNNNYEAATSVSKALTITPRAATGISLNCSTTSVKEGNSVTLTAKLSPETVIEKKVKWTTSDATVAIVDNGIVTGIKVGTATITATTIDGSNLTASCLVNVVPVMVESISLSKSAVQLVLGNSERISAIVLPSNATNKSIRWEVDNSSIASVNDGVITALGIGNTTIKAIANDGSGVYATCSVVVNPIAVSSIELSPITGNVDVGGNITLTATVYPTNASNKQLMWQSSNNDVATVINGIVTGIKSGNVIITAKATDGSNKTATASITVNKIKASNINLNKTSVKLFVGDEETIIATISPSDATIKDVTWSTSNANVATVVNGLVTARGSGTATITAVTTDGTNISATCDVTVNKRTQSILWNQYLESIQYGGQLVELIATASSGLKVKYKSNDDNVVSIFDLGDIVYLNPGNVGKTSVVAYQEGNNEYLPTETTQNIEVVNNSLVTSKTLIAYYSQSALMDGIVAELANQITGSGSSVYTQKIEPTNNRINEANTNREVRDSVMNVIGQYPNDVKSYPPIKSIGVNVNDYDDVIMVYPLWNSMMAAPLQTFSFTYSDALKKKSVAYIEYDLFGDAGASSNAKALRLNAYNIEDKENIIKEWLRNSEATGLLQLHKDRNRTVEGIYDLQGRKVSNVGEHGLYIIKGKKIIVE